AIDQRTQRPGWFVQNSIIIWIRSAGLPAVICHSPEHLTKLSIVHESVAVGIDAFEAILQKRRRFLFGDFAILVGVGFLQPGAEFLRVHASQSALPGAAGCWRCVARTAWCTAGSEHFFRSQFAVAVLIELEQCRTSADDFAGRKLA